MFKGLFYISVFFILNSFSEGGKIKNYNLSLPDSSFILPDTLREISGLTHVDSVYFACIQDENGILFIYDVLRNKIKEQYAFNINGDYEGIAKVGKVFFVLRSDGVLFLISDYDSKKPKVASIPTGIPAQNNEGLCYDQANNRLLIACKGKIGKGPEYKDKRVIYAFDIKTLKLSKEPVYDFNLYAIKEFAIKNKIRLPEKVKKKSNAAEPVIRMQTSAICIHPVTKKLYLLSASDHILFVFDMYGNVEQMEILDPVLFNKPEGVAFLENGDMFISNEGQNKRPTLLRFNYRQE
ncbi:MAG: hypothetical protein K0S32_1286 [Bacteroidetes bacterium]|jgi:uncharacterized protein YjiK|nr:hypothetical protein [Bacteroidota bacterium]